MRDTPRRVRLAFALLLACAACTPDAPAQTRAASATAQGKTPAQGGKAPAQSKAARAAERSRRKAVALLLEVADGAKTIEDGFRRADVLTLCADTLWEADERAARTVFARAWETAVEADEAEFKDEQENGRYGDLPERFTRAREMVLAAAARRDARMSERWLGSLADWLSRQKGSARDQEAPGDAAGGGPDLGPLNEFTRDGQRLALASTLLDDGAYADAARVAAPAIRNGVTGALVEFLLNLREGSPEEADRLYLQLLAAARARKDATANDVLLLSSYALTPRLLAAVNPDGSVSFRPLGSAQDAPPASAPRQSSAQVRPVFYDTAAAVLLLRPPQDSVPGHTPQAVYFAIIRLLPFFQREALRHVDALQARAVAMGTQLGIEGRAPYDTQAGTLSLSPDNPTDPLRERLAAAADAGDPKLRDAARLGAVEEAAKRRLWDRARAVTEEIEDQETRRDARALADAYKVAWVREAFESDDDGFERAAALSRAAEVGPALRAYGLAQAALMAARVGRRGRAAELLEEAFGQASQAEAGSYARDAALMMTVSAAARLESPRAWDALSAAVAVLNEDDRFDGGTIWFNQETRARLGPGEAGALNTALQEFDLRETFEEAARQNFERAAAAARDLKNSSARALALVAAARAELEKGGHVTGEVRPGH